MVLLVSGFLVRHDGSLIAIDSIIWIELLAESFGPLPTRYDIVIHMIEGHKTTWNREPRQEPEAKALLLELRQLIKKAIEL